MRCVYWFLREIWKFRLNLRVDPVFRFAKFRTVLFNSLYKKKDKHIPACNTTSLAVKSAIFILRSTYARFLLDLEPRKRQDTLRQPMILDTWKGAKRKSYEGVELMPSAGFQNYSSTASATTMFVFISMSARRSIYIHIYFFFFISFLSSVSPVVPQ